MLVRSWNLFHGNTLPPGRRSHLEEMIRLATADRPDVLCLQEVPLWSLSMLPHWSGMTERHVVTRKAPLGAWLGGVITRLNNGLFRSRLAGQANAILLAPGLEPLEHHSLRIDERLREPRYCHAVTLDGLVVGNLHATSDIRHAAGPGCRDRARRGVRDRDRGWPSVRARGRLQSPRRASARASRAGRRSGPGIDHVLVRGLAASPLSIWPLERRRQNGARALRSRPSRGHDRMTPAEARALFPVLEHVAYLNAGTFGPLARPTLDAVQQQLQADLERGRVGKPYFDRLLQLRTDVRAALAALVGVEPEHVSLTGSTTDGCNIVLAGLGLGPEDEIVITGEEHFGLTGPVHASGARVVVVDADPDAILAAVTPRTRLLALSHVLWTSGRLAAGARAARALGRPDPRRRRPVGGGDPGRRERPRLPDDLRPEVAVRPGCDRRARRVRPGAAARRPAELLLPVRLRAVRAASSPQPGRPASIPAGFRPPASPAF